MKLAINVTIRREQNENIRSRSQCPYIEGVMCGRFTKNYTWQEIHAMYSLLAPAVIPNMQPSFNVCPTDLVHVGVRQLAQQYVHMKIELAGASPIVLAMGAYPLVHLRIVFSGDLSVIRMVPWGNGTYNSAAKPGHCARHLSIC
jgi:hypothetical protein